MLNSDISNFLIFRSIINWDSKIKSAGALFAFIIFVWYFQPWMIPLGLLIPLIKHIIYLSATGGWQKIDDEEIENFEPSEEVKKMLYILSYFILLLRNQKIRKEHWSRCNKLHSRFK